MAHALPMDAAAGVAAASAEEASAAPIPDSRCGKVEVRPDVIDGAEVGG